MARGEGPEHGDPPKAAEGWYWLWDLDGGRGGGGEEGWVMLSVSSKLLGGVPGGPLKAEGSR